MTHNGNHCTKNGLIGLDWGTSSLRAILMDQAGAVIEVRHRPWGIMNLPPASDGAPDTSHDDAFEHALEDACGDWMQSFPELELLACGMVGSAQGWREAAYLDAPATLNDLAGSLTVVSRGRGKPVHIVPGLIQRGALPNVMRGEETQVLGVLAERSMANNETILIGLPGTHSKWATAQPGGILHFHTYMTGEVFAALRGHTILGKTMRPASAPDDLAFERGLTVARSADGALGLLSNIFSTRTLGLTGALSPTSQADYLSGLLIGHEVASLARQYGADATPRAVLCGDPDLCRRYAHALALYGLGDAEVAPQATARGLWQIAMAAGLATTHCPS